MGRKRHEEQGAVCPVGRFFLELERASGKRNAFYKHLNRSRLEFLKAVRSLMDEKIEDLEKRDQAKTSKRATKIEVEQG